MSKTRSALLWIVILLAFLPVILLRELTPDNELRYLTIADEVLRSGHLFAFTLHGVPYADKPPLYFWLILLSRLAFGRYLAGVLCLFSLVPAVVITHVMERWTVALSVRDRITARLMLMSSVYFIGASIVVRMDMLMTLFIVLALHTFWKMHEGQDRPADKWLFPVYLFLATFTKGPLGLLIPLVSTAAFLLYERQGRTFFRYWSWRTWLVLVVGCSLWFTATFVEGGGSYLSNLLFHQTFGRAYHAFHHQRPFYFYFISVWYELAPWSLLIVAVIEEALRRRVRLSPLQQLMGCTVIATFVLLSVISAKLPIYLLPVFPFAVFLAMSVLPLFDGRRWLKLSIAIPAFLLGLALPAVVVAMFFVYSPVLRMVSIGMAAACLSVSGIRTVCLLYVDVSLTRSLRTLAVGMLAALFFIGLAMPGLHQFLR